MLLLGRESPDGGADVAGGAIGVLGQGGLLLGLGGGPLVVLAGKSPDGAANITAKAIKVNLNGLVLAPANLLMAKCHLRGATVGVVGQGRAVAIARLGLGGSLVVLAREAPNSAADVAEEKRSGR